MPISADTNLEDVARWVSLQLIQGLGNAGLCQLLARFGTPEAIFSASTQHLREVVNKDIVEKISEGIDQNAIAPTLKWLEQDRRHFITLGDKDYPQALLEIANPPAILYAIGDLALLNRPCIAVVGSRNATPQGEKNAEDFAEALCQQGICIVSGMALGIDGAAHRGALKANGATIAVVGTGLDIVYPAKHRDLAHKIAERGLILSEFPLGTPSMAQNFPRRNRIISGLSLGCLVVEANIESGSLITARLAAEQGRDVFAIPGSIHSPVTKGCHQLIKQGASLVESAQDIFDEIQHHSAASSPLGLMTQTGQSSPESNAVLGLMGFDPINFETIQSLSGLTTEALSSMLMVLELENKITALSGGKFQRLM